MAGINSNTVLCLHCDGSDGSTSFPDASPSNHVVTANGDAQVDTDFLKFGTGSLLLDGAGDYISIGDSDDWDFGTGDWTIDFWLRFNNYASTTWPTMFNSGDSDGIWIMYNNNQGALEVQVAGTYIDNAWSPSNGVWYHIAVERIGNIVRSFVNGTQIGSDLDVTGKDITGLTAGVRIGLNESGLSSYYLNGWMDEIRVQKGEAYWTSNFTPPAEAYSVEGMKRGLPLFF